MFNLVLFGPPGSGKGTQSVKLAGKFGLVHISTGDIFRSEIRQKSELGLKVQDIIEKGELVPDALLIEILAATLNKHPRAKGFVFDGFPRTLQQAADLDSLMAGRKESVSLVLALEVNNQEILARLLKRAQLEGRKDDTEEVIKNRIKVYNDQTQPLIDFYRRQGKFTAVNGIGTIESIFDSLCLEVDRKL